MVLCPILRLGPSPRRPREYLMALVQVRDGGSCHETLQTGWHSCATSRIQVIMMVAAEELTGFPAQRKHVHEETRVKS